MRPQSSRRLGKGSSHTHTLTHQVKHIVLEREQQTLPNVAEDGDDPGERDLHWALGCASAVLLKEGVLQGLTQVVYHKEPAHTQMALRHQ